RTVAPRVAVFNNGPYKGGHPTVTATLRRVRGIEAIYQMHRNMKAKVEENTTPDRIANDFGKEKQTGANIVLSVAPDAKEYTVTMARTGKTFRHKPREKKGSGRAGGHFSGGM